MYIQIVEAPVGELTTQRVLSVRNGQCQQKQTSGGPFGKTAEKTLEDLDVHSPFVWLRQSVKTSHVTKSMYIFEYVLDWITGVTKLHVPWRL